MMSVPPEQSRKLEFIHELFLVYHESAVHNSSLHVCAAANGCKNYCCMKIVQYLKRAGLLIGYFEKNP